MTKDEFDRKLQMAQGSTAPIEVKEEYIKKLKIEFYGIDTIKKEKILQDIEESMPDIPKGEI